MKYTYIYHYITNIIIIIKHSRCATEMLHKINSILNHISRNENLLNLFYFILWIALNNYYKVLRILYMVWHGKPYRNFKLPAQITRPKCTFQILFYLFVNKRTDNATELKSRAHTAQTHFNLNFIFCMVSDEKKENGELKNSNWARNVMKFSVEILGIFCYIFPFEETTKFLHSKIKESRSTVLFIGSCTRLTSTAESLFFFHEHDSIKYIFPFSLFLVRKIEVCTNFHSFFFNFVSISICFWHEEQQKKRYALR